MQIDMKMKNNVNNHGKLGNNLTKNGLKMLEFDQKL